MYSTCVVVLLLDHSVTASWRRWRQGSLRAVGTYVKCIKWPPNQRLDNYQLLPRLMRPPWEQALTRWNAAKLHQREALIRMNATALHQREALIRKNAAALHQGEALIRKNAAALHQGEALIRKNAAALHQREAPITKDATALHQI